MRNIRLVSSMAALVGAAFTGPDGGVPSRFVADSRLVAPGDAFVAFRGESSDGHDFIPDAVSRGASLVICERPAAVPAGVSTIQVSDCFTDVPEMARRYLREYDGVLEIIAVTGSVGKTTTREMIRTCLASDFSVHSAEHSYNTLIGCALSILGMHGKTDILLLEMGTNHPGEIREMVRFFPPTVALITEVAAAHLEGLGSVEGVLEAKFEITESPVLKAFFYNGDNPLLVSKSCSLPDSVRSLSLGFEKGDFRIQSTRFSLDDGLPNLTFDFVHEENVFSVRTSLFGRHSALALGFGLALRLYLGAPLGDRVLQDIGRLKAPAGRGRFFRLSCGAVMLDDSYNANPASMRASLSECARIPARRRIAVLGEMRELGGDALEYHRDLLEFLKDFCKVFLMGKIWTDLFDGEPLPFNVFMFENPVRLGEELLAELQEGDLVVVKGSHGNRLDRAVTVLLEGVGS